MQGSAHPTFDPLGGLRAAAAAREAAGLRRHLVPRVAGDAALDLASNDYLGLSGDARLAEAAAAAARVWGTGATESRLAAQRGCAECGVRVGCFRPPSVPAGEACLRLTGRATLTERDISAASRALAVARDRCHHCRNTAQAGRNTHDRVSDAG